THRLACILMCLIFFSTTTPPTEIYTLSLHDALPILTPGMYETRSNAARPGTGRFAIWRAFSVCDTAVDCVCTMSLAAPTVTFSSDRKSTRLNSSHVKISYAVFCLKKKKTDGYLRCRP